MTSEPQSQGIGGIVVPAHTVPVPDTVSLEAQSIIRSRRPMAGHNTPKLSDDRKLWRAYQDGANAGIIAMTERYATEFPGDVVQHDLSASVLYEVDPRNKSVENRSKALLYIHGGGYAIGGGRAALYPAMQFASLARCRTYSIDYRMVPDFPFPTPVDDALEAYQFMLERHSANAIAVFGPSAGATIAAGMLLKARDEGLPLPGGCALHSCPSDMSTWGDSGQTNWGIDATLGFPDDQIFANYANGHDLKDPYLSPVYGAFEGFCPTILTSGTRDLLLSSTVRLHRAMVRAGVTAELHVWEAMSHSPFFGAPEEAELYSQHVAFMLKHTAGLQ